ncbi:RsmB/NOP family class I SAM-dependent RNA methyltransferase [Afifella aestuarii]|uniref:RsmB/NOP family class I SAM-dependent RNA methyltransferase n=1 Tax=Afifella aestuarii TaxID=1909496 RepID=UPI000FE2AA19|nr:RsmB/NOP family class I SAM-dependent RNA methyltransferase [Afifella aestuarii]
MRLPGRIDAAIAVLTDVEERHRPVAEALKDWGLSHRFAGSGDRAAIGDLVYDALRRRASIAWRMGEETPRALALGAVVFHWGESADGVNQLFSEDRHAPEKLTESELERLQATSEEGMPEAARSDVPDFAAKELERAFGTAWVEEATALGERPPLDLRVNTLKAERDKVEGQLARFGVEKTRLSPVGLRVPPREGARRHPNVQADEAYQRGRIEIQDEASQLAALLAASSLDDSGGQILDFCAGGGGKTLALSAALANRGQIYAHDADRHRLAPIFERLKRAGARNVQVRQPGESALDDLAGRMDVVLVDAPCSGSGTWRRRPDAKWRMKEDALQARAEEQEKILHEASRFVRPGGVLVYVTCSLFPAENGERIAAFTGAQPEFLTLDLAPAWDKVTAGPAPRWATPAGLVLTPASTATDGFFVAAMARQS